MRLSQIGAWASEQSQQISWIAALEERVRDIDAQFAGREIPCPPHWGGFHLLPLEFEFWFARDGRLHERFVYTRADVQSEDWQRSMRSP